MSAKIQLGYALGLYDALTRHDLEIFNEIRNVFAHAPHNVTFRNKRLADRTTGLFAIKENLKSGDVISGRDAFDTAIRHYFVPFNLIKHQRYKKLPRQRKREDDLT